ncbi:MAG: type II toxin-antitoxin system RelE/ParE family toxin [Alphaproteobacteria bacterium]|nr:type II toxin-antitoxin system RelE/ParE family toxin [Alphaproteobacteria bacterium]
MTDLVTVVETQGYLGDADYAGMTEEDRAAAVLEVAARPEGGDSLGGGLYKVRIARPGRGKSKGWRVLVAYVDRELPAYLLAVFAKGDRANLTMKEVEALQAEIKKELRDG